MVKEPIGSNGPRPKLHEFQQHVDATMLAAPGMFTAYAAYPGVNGIIGFFIQDKRVKRSSRIFVTPCEYGGTDPVNQRFVGAAPIIVRNVCPFDGQFEVDLDIQWGSPINIRIDYLVDP